MAPPLTFIWRHDRRLDKSTQAFPKYEPILYNKVDKHKRHLRYWIYSKKKTLLGIIFGWDQSSCDLWSGNVYLTKANDCPCPRPWMWPHPCWKQNTALPLHTAPHTSTHQSEKRAKEALLWKGLVESAEKNNSQHSDAGRTSCGVAGGGGAWLKACFSEHTQLCTCSRWVQKKAWKRAVCLQGSARITFPLNLSHKGRGSELLSVFLLKNYSVVLVFPTASLQESFSVLFKREAANND